MRVAIAISSVLGLCIASPANAHVLHSGLGEAAGVTAVLPERSAARDGADQAPAKRARDFGKLVLEGRGKLSEDSLISTSAGRDVLGDVEVVPPVPEDQGEREHRPRRRADHDAAGSVGEGSGHASGDALAGVRDSALAEPDSAAQVRGGGSGALFDEGPQLSGAQKYGSGFAGALGIPGLSFVGEIAPGSTIRLFVENSSNVETLGYLRAGYRETSIALRSGAILVSSIDILIQRLSLAPGTSEFSFTIPAEAEGDVYLQVMMKDSAAVGGWSLSKGLKLLLK